MGRPENPNLEILEIAADALGGLSDELVFLGGCVTALLITDPAAPAVRATRDVDTLAEVGSAAEYRRLESRLRLCGFAVDSSPDAPICRWRGHGILLDVMPTDEKILGFGNAWYPSAIHTSKPYTLPSGRRIRLIDPVHFLATKLEAFAGRGDNDFVMSHDLEDLICVIDGRPELTGEVLDSERALRRYISDRIGALLVDTNFRDALQGHLPGDAGSQARLPLLVSRLEGLAETAG